MVVDGRPHEIDIVGVAANRQPTFAGSVKRRDAELGKAILASLDEGIAAMKADGPGSSSDAEARAPLADASACVASRWPISMRNWGESAYINASSVGPPRLTIEWSLRARLRRLLCGWPPLPRLLVPSRVPLSRVSAPDGSARK